MVSNLFGSLHYKSHKYHIIKRPMHMRYNVEEPAHYPDSIIYRGGGRAVSIRVLKYSNVF